ncbi:MAG: hypothetical protein LC779_01595 [Actinobacteria bacterium]|nr:hypothetical protein [Actinomycetota bacterium]
MSPRLSWRLQRLSHPRSVRRLTVSVSALLAGNLLCGVAYAYWSATGTGAGTVKATTAAPLGVAALTSPLADLYPGKTDDLGFLLSNSNGYPVSLTKLTAVTVTSSDQVGCPGGTYITLPAAVTTGIAAGGYVLPTAISVPAGATATSASIAGLITMATSAPDACQGKNFTVALSFTGSQV